MKKSEYFPALLKSASVSVKRAAHRKKIPIAISENGLVKLIYPGNKSKVVARSSHSKKKV